MLAVGLLAACDPQAPPSTTLVKLADKVVEEPATGTMHVAISTAPVAPIAARRALFVRQLDWELAEGILTNTDPTVPTLNRSGAVVVNAENQRHAQITFAPVKPAGGYTLSISLKRRDAAGTYQVVSSGINAGFALGTGVNTIAVSLSATAQGQLVVSVPNAKLPPPFYGPMGTTTSPIGTGVSSSLDGNAATGTLDQPHGLAMRPDGKLYVTAIQDANIRVVDTSLPTTDAGYLSTLAGGPGPGYAIGDKTTARFNQPKAAWYRADGKLFVSDTANHCIRMIDTTLAAASPGLVTTFAGTNNSGFTNDSATNARFNDPIGIVGDGSGKIYVADSTNHVIRVIDTNMAPNSPAFVATFAGDGASGSADGPAASATFDAPYGLAMDPSGNLYVSDYGSHRIRKITPAGLVSTVAGTSSGSGDGAKAVARFNQPRGIAYWNYKLYVTDSGDDVRVIDLRLAETSSTYVSTLCGSNAGWADGTGASVKFNNPFGLAFSVGGDLYVADQGNHRIRLVM